MASNHDCCGTQAGGKEDRGEGVEEGGEGGGADSELLCRVSGDIPEGRGVSNMEAEEGETGEVQV